MTSKLTNPRTKICAMCRHWNGPVGGLQVKRKVNASIVYPIDLK